MSPRHGLVGVTVDCLDVERVGRFWAALFEAPLRDSLAGWRRLGPLTPDGPVLTFQPVPEARVGKVRLHLDVVTDDLDASIARVAELGGGAPLERHEYPGEGVVVVVADPEGHAFCLVEYAPGVSPE